MSSTSRESQCQRLLEWLRHKPITVSEAQKHLDILSPPPRIQELRAQNHNIVTEWIIQDTGFAKHRVGLYVLLAGDYSKNNAK